MQDTDLSDLSFYDPRQNSKNITRKRITIRIC